MNLIVKNQKREVDFIKCETNTKIDFSEIYIIMIVLCRISQQSHNNMYLSASLCGSPDFEFSADKKMQKPS